MKYTVNTLLAISVILCTVIIGKIYYINFYDGVRNIRKCEYEGHTYLYYGPDIIRRGLCHDENCRCRSKLNNAALSFSAAADPSTELDERQTALLMKYFRKYRENMATGPVPVDGKFSRDDRFLGLLDGLEKRLGNGKKLVVMRDEYYGVVYYMMGMDLGLGYELGVLTDEEKTEVRAFHREINRLLTPVK